MSKINNGDDENGFCLAKDVSNNVPARISISNSSTDRTREKIKAKDKSTIFDKLPDISENQIMILYLLISVVNIVNLMVPHFLFLQGTIKIIIGVILVGLMLLLLIKIIYEESLGEITVGYDTGTFILCTINLLYIGKNFG